MKPSKYNFYYGLSNKIYLYHQISEALLEIDKDLYFALTASNLDVIPPDIVNYLKDVCIIVEDNVEESDIIKFANQTFRYNSEYLRVTILPTLACNFRCWYCYEKHIPSKMSDEAMFAALTFVKEQAISKGKKSIVLDWFGGEPMLYFESIVYPFSQNLISWCNDHNISLNNITTTNGSLITKEIAKKMKEIGFSQFQITLDGHRDYHNKTRYSGAIKNSYKRIVDNIRIICDNIPFASIDLRINYTPQNVHSISKILDDFDYDIRHKITVSPHIVWQNSNEIINLAPIIENFMSKAERMGYGTSSSRKTKRITSCYTENKDQYVINYDLSVYKCTARDFDHKYSIGRISNDGKFQPNGLYYKYVTTPSPFINETCTRCNLLPSCLFATSCIQKIIEGSSFTCCQSLIEKEVCNFIKSKIKTI